MDLVQKFVFWGRGANVPQYLIIHETANPGATALNHVSYWSTGQQHGEAHYVTDWTGIVYHTTPDNFACWHVGGAANSWSVGIELCHAENAADFQRVWDTAVEFAAWYLKTHDWDTSRMMSHYQANQVWNTYSDHTDPIGYFREYGRTWEQFVNAVRDEMEDDMATAEEVWGYDWENTAPQGNMYNCSVAIYKMVESMERKLDALSAKVDKVSAGNIDYAKLAKAVNDDAAKRMQA